MSFQKQLINKCASLNPLLCLVRKGESKKKKTVETQNEQEKQKI